MLFLNNRVPNRHAVILPFLNLNLDSRITLVQAGNAAAVIPDDQPVIFKNAGFFISSLESLVVVTALGFILLVDTHIIPQFIGIY